MRASAAHRRRDEPDVRDDDPVINDGPIGRYRSFTASVLWLCAVTNIFLLRADDGDGGGDGGDGLATIDSLTDFPPVGFVFRTRGSFFSNPFEKVAFIN